jgi:hypothetical protein
MSITCDSDCSAASRCPSRSAADRAQLRVDQLDTGNDRVLRALPLRAVGLRERIDALRKLTGGGHHGGCLRLIGGIDPERRKRVAQCAECACKILTLTGRALHGVDRSQRRLLRRQRSDGGILIEDALRQDRIDRASGR